NNTYCQDNALNWFDWGIDAEGQELLAYTRRLIALRREHPVFRRRSFFQGRPVRGSGVKDILWLRPDGEEMSDADWDSGFVRTLGLRLAGDALWEVDDLGQRIVDDSFLVLLNAWWDDLDFLLPREPETSRWERVLDTYAEDPFADGDVAAGTKYRLRGRSLAVFRLPRTAEPLP
ncbi:MAG: hypothetical protein WCY68_11920, partial [Desulfuromonadales bacterium]